VTINQLNSCEVQQSNVSDVTLISLAIASPGTRIARIANNILLAALIRCPRLQSCKWLMSWRKCNEQIQAQSTLSDQ